MGGTISISLFPFQPLSSLHYPYYVYYSLISSHLIFTHQAAYTLNATYELGIEEEGLFKENINTREQGVGVGKSERNLSMIIDSSIQENPNLKKIKILQINILLLNSTQSISSYESPFTDF